VSYAVIQVADFALQAVVRTEAGLAGKPAALLDDRLKKASVVQTNAPARAAGVMPGLTATQAMARCADIVLRPRAAAAEQEAEAALLTVARSLSPRVERTAEGVCTIDLTGKDAATHLPHSREAVERLRSLGLDATAGIGRTPLLALYAARVAQLQLNVGAQACPFDGFDKLPFDKLRVCDTADKLRAPSLSRGCAHFRRARPSFANATEDRQDRAPTDHATPTPAFGRRPTPGRPDGLPRRPYIFRLCRVAARRRTQVSRFPGFNVSRFVLHKAARPGRKVRPCIFVHLVRAADIKPGCLLYLGWPATCFEQTVAGPANQAECSQANHTFPPPTIARRGGSGGTGRRAPARHPIPRRPSVRVSTTRRSGARVRGAV